jgi:signal transduction histidine kinase
MDILNPCVWSVFEDSRNRLWFGTWGGGLFQSRIETDGMISPPQQFSKIASRNVLASYEDREGNLWFGTTDDGLFCVDKDSVRRFSTANGLSNNDVRAILENSNAELWVGTMNGLNKLAGGTIKIFSLSDGLKSNAIRSLYEDKESVLWVGTYGGGLSRIENGQIVSITTEEGLFDNLVSHIIEDDDGYFWMGCNRGISRVSKQELNEFAQGKRKAVNSVSFGKDYGLVNVETNGGFQPNALKARDGKIYFPTVEGIACLNPKDVRLNTTMIPVQIDYVEVDQQRVEYSSQMTIGPDQNNLVIGYTAPSFIESEKVRFKYMLSGYDQTWIDAKTRREAYYTKLPEGTYTFTVIAANSDGIWNETGASFSLVVIPPFWMTWWFRGIGILVFLSFGPILYVRRVRKLQHEKHVQEQFSRNLLANVEQERKRIATELHDSIGQNLLVIKNRSSFGLRLLPDEQKVKEQLDGISQGASDSLKELRHIAYNLRPFELDRLGLTSALLGMIDKIRESSTINIETQIADIKGVFPKESEINVFRIVQESLNNIIKHSEATLATVKIEKETKSISIHIGDNGKGFDIQKLSSVHKKHGLGISGIEERVRMLGGEMKLNSEPSIGTTIEVTIPFDEPSITK